MDQNDVIGMLERNVDGMGSQKAVAEAIGVSPQYINDVLKGYRKPGQKILDFLEIEVKTVYVWKQEHD